MGKNTLIEAEKQAVSARTEIMRMAEEANARAATMITELTQSLKAEAERSISEVRQSVAGLQGLTTVEDAIAGEQETPSEQRADYETLAAEDTDSLPR